MFALVDDEDYELVGRYKWHASVNRKLTVYARAYIPEKKIAIAMHRLIMGLCAGDGVEVDHIDGDGLNNTRTNIRLATRSENARNIRKISGRTSIYKGVCFYKQMGKWAVAIGRDGKQIYLGLYSTEIDAGIAYNHAAVEYYGEFARLNDIPNWQTIIPVRGHNMVPSNPSGFRGVRYHSLAKKWRAAIRVNGERINLGYYGTPEEAARAYNAEAVKHPRTCRKLNKLDE